MPPVSIARPPQGKHVVVIDPAHGGTDLGVKVSDKINEKDITLAISLLLKKELDKSGRVQVQLTRTSDRKMSISERKKFVAASRSEVFVSIHANSGFGKSASGYEIYFPGFSLSVKGGSTSKDIIKDMAQNKSLNDSVRLAQSIQRNMDKVFPRKNRGLRDAPVPILEGIAIPCIVVEIGFASNPDDRKKLVDEKVRGAVARALSQSIREYFQDY